MKTYVNRIVKYKFFCSSTNRSIAWKAFLLLEKQFYIFEYVTLDYVDERNILNGEIENIKWFIV